MQSRLAEEILEVGEVLLIASSEPLTQAKLNQSLERDDISIDELVKQLQSRFTEQERPVEIHAVAGGYQLVTRAEFKPYLQRLFRRSGKLILSRAALETLAIVAYRQPTTRAEVDQIRGVSSESVLHTLLEKNLVTIKGRDEGVGRPLLYATTAAFLEAFGLDRLGDLPKMKEIDEILTEGEKPSVAEYEVE
ncbi:SMC-Scp complex subunit ScpB [Candidatus Neomarinimicrobiota bacterium]